MHTFREITYQKYYVFCWQGVRTHLTQLVSLRHCRIRFSSNHFLQPTSVFYLGCKMWDVRPELGWSAGLVSGTKGVCRGVSNRSARGDGGKHPSRGCVDKTLTYTSCLHSIDVIIKSKLSVYKVNLKSWLYSQWCTQKLWSRPRPSEM